MIKLHVIRVVRVANLPRKTCHALLGPQHGAGWRFGVGAVVMGAGVSIMHLHVPVGWLEWAPEALGGFVHAIGATPYLEALLGASGE